MYGKSHNIIDVYALLRDNDLTDWIHVIYFQLFLRFDLLALANHVIGTVQVWITWRIYLSLASHKIVCRALEMYFYLCMFAPLKFGNGWTISLHP